MGMKPPLHVRPLTDDEPGTRLRVSLKAGLRSTECWGDEAIELQSCPNRSGEG